MMLKERGTKHFCEVCGIKFYDLQRTPVTCPCGNIIEGVSLDDSTTIDDEDNPEIALGLETEVDKINSESLNLEESESIIDDNNTSDTINKSDLKAKKKDSDEIEELFMDDDSELSTQKNLNPMGDSEDLILNDENTVSLEDIEDISTEDQG